MDESPNEYRTNFFERLINVERDVEELKRDMTTQTPKLDRLILMAEEAVVGRKKISERLELLEPTVQILAEGLLYAKVGRKIVGWSLAGVAAASATVAGVMGGWGSFVKLFWPPK